MTMPVWWTLDHDIALLKLCLVHGYGAWKPIAIDPIVSSTPEDFVMPPKVNGVEWVIQLTPRNAEKRVLALLRGMPQIKSLPLPPPTSPQKKGQGIQHVAPMPSVNKSIFWFQQQKSSASTKNAAECSPTSAVNRTISETSVVSTSDNQSIKNIVEISAIDSALDIAAPSDVEKQSAATVVIDIVSSIGTSDNVLATEATPEEKPNGDDYVSNINAVRSASPVQVIVIDEEEPSDPSSLSPADDTKRQVADPEDTKNAPKLPSSPTNESHTLTKSASIGSDCKSNIQTPQVQTATNAPALEKKGKKLEKNASSKNATPVPASKSILSFFKKM
jgi:hypothetical protein